MDKYAEHSYLCWLDQIRGLGRKSLFALLHTAGERTLFSDRDIEKSKTEGGAGEIAAGARTLYTAPETQIRFLCAEAFPSSARAQKAERLLMKARKVEAERIEENLMLAGITFCCILEEGFPERLRTVPDPPFGLYFKGGIPLFGNSMRTETESGPGIGAMQLPERRNCHANGSVPPDSVSTACLQNPSEEISGKCPQCPQVEGCFRNPVSGIYGQEPAAAIIGARLASGYGREQARRFSYRLASRGITIISGMARGIDGIAQMAALDAGGKSYAVLGCGVDICYPEENRKLYDRLLQQGGIISEYPPGTFPEARLFPQRNRIISGLADLVLVIEARKKSGTLITVDMALEQGREVFALPGRVSDSLSDGCNRLIRQGAGAATCPEDILEYFFGTGDEDTIRTWKKDPEQKHFTEDDSEKSAGRQYNIQSGTEERIPEERSGESENPDKPALSLEQRILQVLSREDEKHMERILEDIRMTEEQPEISARNNALSDVIACLTRLKIDGRIEETASGYYRRSSR